MTVPLGHDGTNVGVLSCYSAVPQGFSEDHLRLLELLAPSLSAAVAAVPHTLQPAAPPAAAESKRSNLLVMAP